MSHPELAAEQAYVDRAYARLEEVKGSIAARESEVLARGAELKLDPLSEPTWQHGERFQRDAAVHDAQVTLQRLSVGDYALVFGRMDTATGETTYLGRVGVRDRDREPLVVDWRAQAAEAFYRAVPADPCGLARRRHLSCDGPRVLDISDDLFDTDGGVLSGPSVLLAALTRRRTGKMRDIVATVQREQDEIIRSPLDGVLVVTGGPGTGKTAVALHRAAYLLFTNRQKLGRRGILVVGPNPVFLGYVDQVLPALGESLAELSTVAGLVGVKVTGAEPTAVAALKGDVRMVEFVERAVADRERPVTRDVRLVYDDPALGELELEVPARKLASIPGRVRRRRGTHNDRRPHAERLVLQVLWRAYREEVARRSEELTLPPGAELSAPRAAVAKRMLRDRAVRRLLDRVWPVLTPTELLSDLLDSRALLASAGRGILSAEEVELLHRPWSEEPAWTQADAPLLEEAWLLLGPTEARQRSEDEDDDAAERGMEIPAFGHVVVDEAQDLTPMQLRVVARRSLRGSMTLVGDVAQRTAPGSPDGWAETLRHLPGGEEARFADLSVNYRTPEEIMAFASPVLRRVDPALRPPTSVRRTGTVPRVVEVAALAKGVAEAVDVEGDRDAMVAVICGVTDTDAICDALGRGTSRADHGSLHGDLVVVPAPLAKGLEFDAVVVAEPAEILRDVGHRGLYVALTRTTDRLVVVHSEPLPGCLQADV